MQIAKILRYLFCLIVLMLMRQFADAQQYAVTASTQIIPPYSVYLPDYVVPGSDKMRVILVQNDLTRPSYDVILRMTIEQNGVVIMRTSTRFNPRPLTLSAGVPTIISGVDLTDYLNSDNIDFTGGFSRETYEKNKALPEGAYRITFTAFDFRRPTLQVSNPGANIFYFRKNDPPLLNLPICGSRVEKRDPQFLTFSWSSRSSATPVEGSVTEYVFSLYEIKPKGSNPDYIIRSARPLYTITTENTNIIYGPGEPALTDSMEYAWIVQARDRSGRDAFSNQGYSLSCKFLYLGNNPFQAHNIAKPTITGKTTGERSIRLSWPLATGNAGYNVDAYRVQYHAAAKDGKEFDWYTEEKTTDSTLDLHSLEPATTYEARLQWRVAGVYGPYSELAIVNTDPLKTFNCGDANTLQLPQNSKPQPSLIAGNIVKVGHFDVMLTEVAGGDGTFSGKGKVITPGFGMGLAMQFSRVSVNTDLVVTGGEMQAVTEGIDKFTADAIKEQRGGNDVGQVVSGDIVPDITTRLHIFTKENIQVDTDKGTITLTDSQTGEKETIDYGSKGKSLPIVIEDTDGNLYNIDKGGKVTSAGKRDQTLAGNPGALAALNNLDLSKGKVTFAAGKDNKYAFDSWNDNYFGKKVLEDSYQSLADGAYRVSSKAIVPNAQEEITATLQNAGKDIDPAKVKFINGKGITVPSKNDGNTYTITITGGPGSDAQELYAVYPAAGNKYTSMGKLLIASYEPKQLKVVLIPVGKDTKVPENAIRESLEKSYGKVGINYTVTTDESFRDNKDWDSNGDNVLQDAGSSFLSNGFTGEEKAMKKAYRNGRDIDEKAAYLFVINEVALKDGDLLGKMPRESQFGYLFVAGAADADVARTAAHEIGHGNYTLEHTFAAGIGLSQSSTNNLMDYGNDYSLFKYQWDIVHDPGNVWGIFEGDQDDENYIVKFIQEQFLNDDKKTVTFLTPAGTAISLPRADIGNLQFEYGAVYASEDNGWFEYAADMAAGALHSFFVKDEKGEYQRYVYNYQLGHYEHPDAKYVYVPKVETDKVTGVIYPIPCGDTYTLYKFKWANIVHHKDGETYRKFDGIADVFKPFTESAPVMMKTSGSGQIKQVLDKVMFSGCLYCMSELTRKMTEKHCTQSEILWVDKLAQMRNVYTEYWDRFTQPDKVENPLVIRTTASKDKLKDGDWEMPKEITYATGGEDATEITISPSEYPWGKYLEEHPDVKALYTSDKAAYFKVFYQEFDKYIKERSKQSDEFWATFSEKTFPNVLIDHLATESVFTLSHVDLEKRMTAIRILAKEHGYWSTKENELIKMLMAFTPPEYPAALDFLTKEYGYKWLYENFDNNHPLTLGYRQALTEILMIMCHMIGESEYGKPDIEKEKSFIDNPDGMPEIESDLLRFRNFNWEFSGKNKVTIPGYGTIPCEQTISVRVAGSFTFNGKLYQKGLIMQMPAIQAILISHVNTLSVTERSVMVGVDAVSLFFGIGEMRLAFKTGSLLYKTISIADVVGSALGATAQLINNDVLDEKMKSRIQMASFVLQLPSIIAPPQSRKLISEIDDVIRTATYEGRALTKAAVEELIEIRSIFGNQIRVADYISDAAELERRVVSLGDDLKKTESWLAKVNDGNYYVVVHSDGSKFKVIMNGVEETLDDHSLAKWLDGKKIPEKSNVVLLSCSDLETAKNLSKKWERDLIANDGWVEIGENGVIRGENAFKQIKTTGEVSDLAATSKLGKGEIQGNKVRLGFSENVVKKTLKWADESVIGSKANNFMITKVADENGNIVGEMRRSYFGKEMRYEFIDFVGGNGITRNQKFDLDFSFKIIEGSPDIPLQLEVGRKAFYAEMNLPPVLNVNYKGLGKMAFDDAFAYFEKYKSFDCIYHVWVKNAELYSKYYKGESINYTQYMKARAANLSEVDAAFETIGGKWAKEKGYTEARNVTRPGATDELDFIFTKPKANP